MQVVLKISRAVFGFAIVTLNASIVLAEAVLNIMYPSNPYTTPVVIFIDTIGNAAIVLLTTEQQVAPPP